MLSDTRPSKVGNWTEPALRVLRERYLTRKSDEVVETPEEMCWRVALSIAQAEERYGRSRAAMQEVAAAFYDLMVDGYFLPNCLTLDSLISVEGGLQPLGDIPAGPADVRVATDEGEQRASFCFANGPKRVLTVQTASGYTVRATPEHFFRVIDETGAYVWRRAGDLQEGDWMALQPDFLSDAPPVPLKTTWPRPVLGRPRQEVRLPAVMTPELAEIVGYYIGDGYIKKEEGQPRVLTLAVDAQDEDVIERLTRLLSSLFRLDPRVEPIPGKRCVVISVNSTEVCQFFYENGLAKAEGAVSAHVPKAILQGGRGIARAFLRGLLEADGTVGERVIELYSTSLRLSQVCQLLLLGLGIASHYRSKQEGYRVGIRKNQDGARFVQVVGFLGQRKNQAALAFVTPSDNASGHVIPHQAAALHGWYQEHRNYALYRQIARFMITGPYAQPISTEAFHRYASRFPVLEESPVAEHVARRQLYDPVVSIVPGTVEETGDLHVPAGHTFIANGFVSHNSPTLMNAGKGNQLQYSACYVLPVGDSMEEIFDAVKAAAIIHKCLVGDTFVMSNGLTRLSEVRDGALVMTDEGPFHASGLHDNGEQPVFEVKTNRGYTIVGTAEHRLLAVADNGSYEWRKIGEIREGDWLVMNPGSWVGGETKLTEFTPSQKPGRNRTSFKPREYRLPRELTPELAELIGLYIGDGSNHRDGIRFTVGGDCPEVIERIKELSLALFGKTPSVSKYPEKNAFEVSLLSVQIKEWFAFLGITTKVSSREARIPEIILRSPEEVACAFARGLFTADGCVRENGHITLTTSSRRLGEELQIMLLALGVPTHLRRDVSAAHYESWQVSICTKAGFRRFREKIGFAATKKAGRLAAVADEDIFVKGETIPNQRGRLRAWYAALPPRSRREAKIHFDDLLNRVTAPRELSRQRLTAVMQKSAPFPPFFEELAAEEFFFVRVTTIGYAGIRRVYDLTVPVKHAYVANGFASHNSGGGTGFAFSRLRPKDDLVASTGGKASGPVSFLRVFNGATEAVKQGGTRRGANMGILKVDHPDILEFIECKLDGGITNFNISVAATDRFMDALEKGEEYELINPHTGAITGKLSAREVFERIVRAAWRTGDPGMVFLDRINRSPANPTPEVGMVEATNPCGEQPLLPNEACFAPETRITTDGGLETVADLYERQRRGESILVATNLNGKGMQIIFRPAAVLKVGVKPTVRVTLTNGQQIRVTADHKILTEEGWKEAGTLAREDRVLIQTDMAGPLTVTSTDGDLQRMFGWFTGDGWFTDAVGLTFGPADELAFERLVPVWRQFTGSATRVQTQAETMVRCIGTERAAAIATFKTYGFEPGRGPKKRMPKSIFTAPKEEQIRYLQGLFGADGSKTHRKPQVTLSSASLELLRDVQLLLLNLGMRSNIKYYPHRPTGRAWGQVKVNGESYHRFLDLIGFPLTPQKQERCDQFPWQRTKQDRLAIPVASVAPDEQVEVYDVSEPVTHSLIAEGMIVHNCNLGSLNVSKFARRADNGEWTIDWEDLERVVRLSVRFLDDVIEMNPYPLPEIDRTVKSNRRIGLGIMGWADLLFIMGIPYDSQEALDLAEQIMASVKEKAHDQSAKLAEERGPFPNWSRSIYKHGRPMRNSTITTIAPTGTISMIAGCSSGIEPIFALAFEHRVKQPDGERVLPFVNEVFERLAREQSFYSEALMQEVLKRGSLHGIPGVPEQAQRVFKTSHEIPYEWHVRHQAVYQEFTDNGVSKTINLPNAATEEDVASAYLLAWKLNCLGITVFRDGCKGEQVLNVGIGAKTKKEEVAAPTTGLAVIKPRPHSLHGLTYRMETPIGTAFITVNETPEGEPFEVFVQVGKGGSDTMAVAEALGRLISLVLRLPSPFSAGRRMEEVISQLSRIGGGQPTGFGPTKVLSLPDALARTLAEYLGQVKPETNEEGNGARPHRIGDLCKECGQATFIYEEGCKKCLSCGYNEC